MLMFLAGFSTAYLLILVLLGWRSTRVSAYQERLSKAYTAAAQSAYDVHDASFNELLSNCTPEARARIRDLRIKRLQALLEQHNAGCGISEARE